MKAKQSNSIRHSTGKAVPLIRLNLLFTALLLLHPAVGIEKAGREGQYLLKGMVTAKIIKK